MKFGLAYEMQRPTLDDHAVVEETIDQCILADEMGPAELAAIKELASDLPALWQAETTTQAERQTIVRLLLERVLVTVVGGSEQVRVECHWQGDQRSAIIFAKGEGSILELHRGAGSEDQTAKPSAFLFLVPVKF